MATLKKIFLFIACFHFAAYIDVCAQTKHKPKYTLTGAAIFRNEGRFLKEWLDYHLALGFEHFWMYNNESSDNSVEVLQPYIDQGLVTLFFWPNSKHPKRHPRHMMAYNDAIRRAMNKTKWISCFDIDEYMVLTDFKQHLHDFLKEFEAYPGIVLNWQCYGTSNIQECIPGQMTSQLLYRADRSHSVHRHVKSIVQPKQVSWHRLHHAIFKKGALPVNTLKQPTVIEENRTAEPCYERMFINHYIFKDQRFLHEEKIKRFPERGHILLASEQNHNKVYDPVILQSPYHLHKA